MIDLDAIEKECQQMIADGLGFIAPKSCGNAEMVAALVAELKRCRDHVENLEEAINEVIELTDSSGDCDLRDAISIFMLSADTTVSECLACVELHNEHVDAVKCEQ